jgi:hypothetical protein
MNRFNRAVAAAVAVFGFIAAAPKAQAQVSVDIGAEPDCPYGYYDYAPYSCAPDGYYGPEWFLGGVFLGAGPWFHGPEGFRGRVDHHFDVRHGYRGPLPNHGDHADGFRGPDQIAHFGGSEMHDGHGFAGGGRR